MANTNSPNGFRPVRHMTGGCVRQNEYSIESTLAENIRTGDVVQMTGTGKNVILSEAGNVDNIGVFNGVRYVDASGNQVFAKQWTSGTIGTDIVAFVYDDPSIVYEVQVSTLAEADVGNHMDLAAGTGSSLTGVSGAYLDETTKGTADQQFKVMELVKSPVNAYGAYAKVYCVFAEHVLRTGAAGAGGI